MLTSCTDNIQNDCIYHRVPGGIVPGSLSNGSQPDMSMDGAGRPRPEPVTVTPIPGPRSQEWITRDKSSESGGNAYPEFFGTGVYSPIIHGADGQMLVDLDGNSFLESSGVFSCSSFGALPKELIETAVDQMRRLVHVPDLPTTERIECAEALLSIAPGDLKQGRVQFDLGGAGAMDLAYKLAYYSTRRTHPESGQKVVGFAGSYHGRTTTTSSLTASAHAQEGMPQTVPVIRFPFPYCYRCPFGKEYPSCDLFCSKFVRQQFEADAYGIVNPRTGVCQASIMLWEPIQAHIGMIFPPQEFMGEMRQLCDDYGMLMIDDEIAMGIGHTGNWFAADTYDTVPDIVATSKALTGGVWPLGAVIAKEKVWAPWSETPDRHMGSYHGNPVGCAVATKNIRLIEERRILENVRQQGAYCNERINALKQNHALVGDGQAVGLTIGIELVCDRVSKEPAEAETIQLVKSCLSRGLLVLRLGYFGNRLNMMPSMDSSRAEIDFIFDTLDECLSEIEKHQ